MEAVQDTQQLADQVAVRGKEWEKQFIDDHASQQDYIDALEEELQRLQESLDAQERVQVSQE